jgi:hypothetical protein
MKLKIFTPIITTPVRRSYQAPWLAKRSDKVLLLEDFAIHVIDEVTNLDETIVVPRGYVFDWSSIPKLLWSITPPTYSQSRYASLVHDYIYSHLHHHYSKEFADRLFKAMMQHFNAPSPIVFAFYHAVRWFGRGGWTRRLKRNADPHWREVYEKVVDYHADKSTLRALIEPFLDQELNFLDSR